MNTPQQPIGPKINIPEGMQPTYTNLARIWHSYAEVIIDFAHILPAETTANINARVVMTPLSAKLLLRALTENLARYEAAFGEIKLPSNSSLAENLFRRFQPPESPEPPEPPKE